LQRRAVTDSIKNLCDGSSGRFRAIRSLLRSHNSDQKCKNQPFFFEEKKKKGKKKRKEKKLRRSLQQVDPMSKTCWGKGDKKRGKEGEKKKHKKKKTIKYKNKPNIE
jgi:hypothetical protein